MTERTYHKDLGIVINHLREYMALDEASQATLARLYETMQPLYTAHCAFLDSLEKRMSQCETRISETISVDIGDLICDHFNDLEVSIGAYYLAMLLAIIYYNHNNYLCDLHGIHVYSRAMNRHVNYMLLWSPSDA